MNRWEKYTWTRTPITRSVPRSTFPLFHSFQFSSFHYIPLINLSIPIHINIYNDISNANKLLHTTLLINYKQNCYTYMIIWSTIPSLYYYDSDLSLPLTVILNKSLIYWLFIAPQSRSDNTRANNHSTFRTQAPAWRELITVNYDPAYTKMLLELLRD